MRQRTLYSMIGILILTFACLLVDLAGTAGSFTIFGHGTPVRQGLDLTGGLRMLLKAQDSKAATSDAMSAAQDIITKRVNAYGVSEPVVQTVGSDSIDVEVPGVKDPEQLRATLGSTGLLVVYGMGTLPHVADGAAFTYKTTTPCDVKNPPTPCVVIFGSELDAGQISSGTDQYGAPIVNFGAKGKGADRLSSYTSANVGTGHMAIVLDGKVVTDPNIQGAITGGNGVITGIGTIEDASAIAIRLKYGALPIAFTIQASEQISATLGPQYVHASIIAGLVGMAIVMIFMLL